jgi:hypothetical protein
MKKGKHGAHSIPLLACPMILKFITEVRKNRRKEIMSMINRSVESVKNHIAKLQQKPVENAKLIKKWERLLRNMQKNSVPF